MRSDRLFERKALSCMIFTIRCLYSFLAPTGKAACVQDAYFKVFIICLTRRVFGVRNSVQCGDNNVEISSEIARFWRKAYHGSSPISCATTGLVYNILCFPLYTQQSVSY